MQVEGVLYQRREEGVCVCVQQTLAPWQSKKGYFPKGQSIVVAYPTTSKKSNPQKSGEAPLFSYG